MLGAGVAVGAHSRWRASVIPGGHSSPALMVTHPARPPPRPWPRPPPGAGGPAWPPPCATSAPAPAAAMRMMTSDTGDDRRMDSVRAGNRELIAKESVL